MNDTVTLGVVVVYRKGETIGICLNGGRGSVVLPAGFLPHRCLQTYKGWCASSERLEPVWSMPGRETRTLARGWRRGSSIGGGNPGNVPVGLRQSDLVPGTRNPFF